MSTHEHLQGQLSAFLDGELTADERAEVEAHLPGCADCRGMLDALRATVADLRALGEPAPSDLESRLLREAIRRARTRQPRVVRAAAALGGVAAVLAGVMLIGGRDGGVTGADDTGVLSAPGAGSIAGLIVEDRNYDEASVDALLADPQRGTHAVSVQPQAPAEERATAGGAEAYDMAAGPSDEDLARCESEIGTADASEFVPQARIAARFKGKPALLLVYRVDAPDHSLELWVLRRGTCDVLYYRDR